MYILSLIGNPVYTRYPIKEFYLLPKRLTLKSNPAIYRWGYWNYSWDKRVLGARY
jgi:hypothetical protein